MNNNGKKLLLFDFDGVIVDSLETIHTAYNTIHSIHNLPYARTQEDIREKLEKNFFQTLTEYGLTQEQIEQYFYGMKKQVEVREDQIKLFPDIDTLLLKISSSYDCAIVTSGHKETVMRQLTKYNIDQHFGLLLGADSEKSKVEKIKKALNHFNRDKESTYFITDTIGDIEEGKEVGVTTIAVSWGYHNRMKLEQANPDYLFDNVAELENFLLNL